MRTRSVHPRALLLFLCATLLVVGLLPPPQTSAAVFQLSVGNTTRDFSQGAFQRTALASLQSNDAALEPLDQPGAIQLAPIGLLKDWTSATALPQSVSHHGAAALGNRIFVIGGRRFVGNQQRQISEVLTATVDLDTGIIAENWGPADELPLATHSVDSGFTTRVAAVESPAVAAVDNASGNDYIYVIGGTVSFGVSSISSFAVRVATVGQGGDISAWRELTAARLPSPDPDNAFLNKGLSGASATVFRARNGRTYLYVLGGLQLFEEDGNGIARASRGVLYAEVAADGRLLKPGTTTEGWTLMPNAQIPVDSDLDVAGLWNAGVVADRFPEGGDGLFLTGGQEVPGSSETQPVFSSVVYRARIANNGALTWITPNETSANYTLPEPRYGHGATVFNGNIYLTGGQSNEAFDPPQAPVLTSYVTGTLELPDIGDGGSQFLKNDNALDEDPRSFHATVLIKASEAASSLAYIYVLGGVGSPNDGDPSDDRGTQRVIFGRIGGSEDIETDGYVPDGIFYSRSFDAQFQNAQVQEINWTTVITRTGGVTGMDVAVDYRTSLDNDCNNPTWTDTSWRALSAGGGVRSNNGNNSSRFTNLQARCFQFRAQLRRGSNRSLTPALLGVSIEVFIPGSPDLNVSELAGQFNAANQFTGLKTTIRNRYTGTANEPTLDADVESPGQGQFFVDLVIFTPGQTPTRPTIPINPNAPSVKGYVRVNKSDMPALATLPITRWCAASNTTSCQPIKWSELFPRAGTYNVFVVVDSYCGSSTSPVACVNESITGAENNNVSGPVQVVIRPKDDTCTGPDCDPDVIDETPTLYLPFIGKAR